MRKRWLAALVLAMWAWALPGMAEADPNETAVDAPSANAEWTVMFYLCGSDLESRYGFASEDLTEIIGCTSPTSRLPGLASRQGEEIDPEQFATPGKVNVVIETGGSSAWHIDEQIMAVDTAHLQRWHLDLDASDGVPVKQDETLPLASMADPRTLADFIQWSARAYPAERYALVLWDHGGGSMIGLFVDELFDNDVLHLDELRSAFKSGGVHFEAVLMDACMMAGLETAWAIHESADWMIASEEVVAGNGTAISLWLQELFNDPSVDGLALGRNICDMTQIKYANLDNEQARQILTWSVIDLSKIPALVEQFDLFYKVMDYAIDTYPELVKAYADLLIESEQYGDGSEGMRDLAHMFYQTSSIQFLDYNLRRDMLQALREAVVYNAHGAGRTGARGLSFCCATDFLPKELEIYANSCPSPHYLAFLDAITDWDAPDWVYETTMRPPGIAELEEYQIKVEKRLDDDGFPCLWVRHEDLSSMREIGYRLIQHNAATGQTLSLGGTVCTVRQGSEEGMLYGPNDLMQWPAIEGEPCDMELIRIEYANDCYVFEIPIQLGRDEACLRCGRWFNILAEMYGVDPINRYEVFGVWDGYDEDTNMPNRNVRSLAQLAGQEYQLLYPVESDGDEEDYAASKTLTMYRSLEVQEITLPAGEYTLDLMVNDMFGRTHMMDSVDFQWDGQTFAFPEDFTWEGEVTINPVYD